jgi:serine protease inhibitor
MHPSTLSRRRLLSFTGAAAAAPLLARLGFAGYGSEFERTPFNKLIAGINAFAGELNKRLVQDEPGSCFFSPFSIEAALAMTVAGARGDTLVEMQKTLHLPDEPHAEFGNLLSHLNADGTDKLRPYELTIANAIWAQSGFPWHKEFAELTRKHYGAGLIEVNFAEADAARKSINDWVEKQTKEKIKDLVPVGTITALTCMVLANAIYFKGTWQYQFDKKFTRDAPFTRADNSKVSVPLMHQTGEFAYGQAHVGGQSGGPVQFLELPYSGRELSMLILLPEAPHKTKTLADTLTDGKFVRTELKTQRVRVWLPRFKAESKFLLNQPLKDLGMNSAFRAADFTGMSPQGRGLSISHVLHKAYVDVNEEGTEAAAATAVVLKAPSNALREVVFRADRPFVYVIRDNKTGAALFMGRFSGPEK